MSSDELKSASNHDVLSEWVFNLGFIQALAQGFVSLLFLFFCAGIRKSQISISKWLNVLNQEAPFSGPKSAKMRPKFFSQKTPQFVSKAPQFGNFLVKNDSP